MSSTCNGALEIVGLLLLLFKRRTHAYREPSCLQSPTELAGSGDRSQRMMADVQQMALRRDLPLWLKLLLLMMMVLMVLQCRHRCDVIGAAHCNERRMLSSSIYRRSYT